MLCIFALAYSQIQPPATLDFSGYTWDVKSSDKPVGPGPNYFSAKNAWVDKQGYLHLKISQVNGKWQCAEIICQKTLGYGIYRFTTVGSPIFDPNATLGMFTWSDADAFHHREIDIELGKWSNPKNLNAQFVVQPYTTAANIHRFDVPPDATDCISAFAWGEDQLQFELSVVNSGSTTPGSKFKFVASTIVDRFYYNGADNPQPGDEKTHINLWLVGAKPPTDGKPVEVVLKKFEFLRG